MIRLILILFIFKILNTQDIDDEIENYRSLESFVELKGGDFIMGVNDREGGVNYEYPAKKAHVEPFRILLYPVTNAAFRKFKNEKLRHRTDAENTGSSWVFKPLMHKNAELDSNRDINDLESQEALKQKMLPIKDAKWNKPEGGKSTIRDRLDYPAVHVSYNDAFAYCAWKGMRLPTEIEWEFAARGGLREQLYPWGERWEVGRTNLWQGKFPEENQLRDGHYGLSPVNAFKAQNIYEMYDLIGNTWEWTSSIFRSPHRAGEDPSNRRVLKGGSFLDTRDGETKDDKMRIRISSRMGRIQNYSAQNLGFRCAQTIKKGDKIDFSKSNFRVVRLRPPKKFDFRPIVHQEL
ncbi:unnamed protein product [Brachionus calyciflorus]|uniref:Sulfatase-modifying factor enzyme-like domain-containing protein n=1 Tax=Brachionus calyciflorus TaxID=104777 RepID=A0A813XWE6_9BILA|nr:unnamed protein product [Brachionus calyciflorus]